MRRLGFLERPKMSCMCAKFGQSARIDMFGTKAAYRAHGGGMLDAVRNVPHMRDVHTWSGAWSRRRMLLGTLQSLFVGLQITVSEEPFTQQGITDGVRLVTLADGGLHQDLIDLAQTHSKATRHRD